MARSAAPVTFLQINDVYTTLPVDGQGGLARVATLKQNLAKAGRTPFLVIAGDFLSPSVASSVFKGEHMIAALNAAGLDLATLGNHEFDFGDDVLIQRMHEATFQWVVSNVVDTKTGQPIGGAAPYRRQDVRHAEGRLHRPVPQHAGDHRRQAEAHAHPRSADGGRPVPADAEAGRRDGDRRRHAPDLRRRPRAGRAVSRHRSGDRRPRALRDHGDRAPIAHQQGRIGREVRRAHRREPAPRRHDRALLRAAADHERARRRSEDGRRDRVVRVAPQHRARDGRRHHARAARRRQPAPALVGDEPRQPGRRRHPRRREGRHRDHQLRQHPRQPRLPRRAAHAADAARNPPVRQRDLRPRPAGTRRARGAEPRRLVAAGGERHVSRRSRA